MATITTTDLKLRTLQRADMENSEFISDSELLYFVNNSFAELYDILVSKFEDYYVKSPAYEFTLTGSDYTQELPTDFYKLRGVDRSAGGSDDWYTLHPFQFEQRNDNRSRFIYRAMYPDSRYRIYGNKLILSPANLAAGDYRVWYVPKFTPLVLGTDTVDGVNGWEEYIVVDAAIKCLQKEESDISALVMQKNELIKRIQTMAANRDAGSPERITDTSLSYAFNDFHFGR